MNACVIMLETKQKETLFFVFIFFAVIRKGASCRKSLISMRRSDRMQLRKLMNLTEDNFQYYCFDNQ